MSHKIRYLPSGGALVEVTYRTLQGRYLLRPGQNLNEIVAGVLARAQSLYPTVELIGISVLSNHLHMLVHVDSQKVLSSFLGYFAGNVARKVNRLRGWSGPLWHRRYRAICITDEPAAQVARLKYLLSQGVKEHLVEKVQHWPGIHFGKTLLEGRTLLAGKWTDQTRLYQARVQGKELSAVECTNTLTVRLHQLPCWRHLTSNEYLARVRELVAEIEKEAEEERRQQRLSVLGVAALCRQDPQTRPARVKRSPAPLVHAATRKARRAWRAAYGWFVEQYRAAAEKLKQGDSSATFPAGCFPPGLPFVEASAGGLPLPTETA